MHYVMNCLKGVGRALTVTFNVVAGLVAMVFFGALVTVMGIGVVTACFMAFSDGGRSVGFGVLCTVLAILWALARQGCFRSAVTRATVSQKF